MNEQLINIFGISSVLTIIALAIALVYKMERVKSLTSSENRLRRSLDEMDEQAKLIVRTDMELNKTQEELDKKIGCLYALHKLSKAIGTTLEENQIFKMVSPENLDEMGFEKACGFLFGEKEGVFYPQLIIGYSAEEALRMRNFINSEREIFLGLISREGSLSSTGTPSSETAIADKISRNFLSRSFILSSVLPKEGEKGFFFAGTNNTNAIINDGDKELVIILANQISQALDNARLFEKTWRAQQDLEAKVEERTRELTRAFDEVKKVSKRKTDFISAVSHELRTPLTSIKGYASILLAGNLGELPAQIRERLAKVNRHTDELVHMVNDLLDIARIESGRMPMKKEDLDLKTVVAGVLDLLTVQLKEKDVEAACSITEPALNIFADKGQIERVFINLVNNAIKFTPAKGRITIRATVVDKNIWVDVTDTGCGIPQDSLEAIFEEFYRVENAINDSVKGTGLGLSLVKHIIEAHNGKIWVKSQVGIGSTFSFTIPKPE